MQMLTIRELAEASGWPEDRIRKLVKARLLDHLPVDGLTLLPANAIEQFTNKNMVKACPKDPLDRDLSRVDKESSGLSATLIQPPDSNAINRLAQRIAEGPN